MKVLEVPSFVIALFVLLSAPCLAAETGTGAAAYTVLEISRFDVNREDFSSKESERAGRIPEEILDTIQRILITEYTQTKVLPTVRKKGPPRDGDVVLELGGTVVDWIAGSPTKRMLIGMGAGQ